MRNATVILASLLTLPVIAPSAGLARPAWISGTFVYADLCTDEGAGRLEGRRVTVRRSPNGDGVLYEAASGASTTPLPADAVSIDDGTRHIAFTVESEAGPVRIEGVVASDMLTGTISDGSGERTLQLRRVLRSREREACRSTVQDPETTASVN